MALPTVPNFVMFSIASGIAVFLLIEIFRPELLGFKDSVRKNIKIEDAKTGIIGRHLG